MSTWLVIAAIGLGTYAMRASMFLVVGERVIPAWLERSLGLAGPAAIAAVVATMVLVQDGHLAVEPAPTIAVVVGFLVVRRTGNVIHAFGAGLPTFWLLTAAGM
jgi:branched-subunit amino acid transport protein